MDKKVLSLAAALVIVSASQALAEDLAVGKKLYVDNWQRCHGASGGGGIGMRLKGDAAYWDFPIFKRTLMEGHRR